MPGGFDLAGLFGGADPSAADAGTADPSGFDLGSLIGSEPTGADPTTVGLLGAYGSSPFLQGVPSQSGPIGQIAQAVMPFAVAKTLADSERTRQQQTHTKMALETVGLLLKVGQLQRQGVLDAATIRKTLAEAGLKEHELDMLKGVFEGDGGGDAGATGGTAGGSKLSAVAGKLPAGASLDLGALKLSGPKEASSAMGAWLANHPNATDEQIFDAHQKLGESSGMSALAAAISGPGGLAQAFSTGKESFVLRKNPTGGTTMIRIPSGTEATAAFKQLDSLNQFDTQLSKFEAAVKANPTAVGGWPQLKNLLSGVGVQYDNVRRDAMRIAAESGGTAADKAEIRKSPDFKNLFDPAASEQSVMRSALVFQAAAALFGQSGRMLSDNDRKMAEGLFGPDIFANPADLAARLATMRSLAAGNRENAARMLSVYTDEQGNPVIGSEVNPAGVVPGVPTGSAASPRAAAPKGKPAAAPTAEAANAIYDWYKEQGMSDADALTATKGDIGATLR